MRLWFGPRFVLAVFSFFAVGAALAVAVPPAQGEKDILDDARRREQVAQQKAEADFRAALLEVNKLENANSGRAVERLKRMLAVLEEDTTLSADKRAAWARVLKDRIRIAEAEADRAAKEAASVAAGKAAKDDRKAVEDQKISEENRLKEDFKTLKKLQISGETEEAQRLANAIASRHPDTPAASAARYITGVAGAKRASDALKEERNNRWLGAMGKVEESAMPAVNDIEFPSPAKWREITKMRTKSQATEREKAIIQALESPVSAKFKGSSFESVIDYIQTLTGQTIIVDKATLEAAQITYDTPINAEVRRASLRTLLRKVLGEVGLTYVVKNEVIQVVTPKQAQDMLTVRSYYLGDLADTGGVSLGPVFDRVRLYQTVSMLIQTITESIEPDSWKVNNPEAKGTIIFNPATLTLTVKQSAEIHYMLGGIGR